MGNWWWDVGPSLWIREYVIEFGMEQFFISRNKKFKNHTSAGRLMITIFYDVKGLFFVHFTPKGEEQSIVTTAVIYWDY